MSTIAHIDLETISPTDRAQSSRVPIPLFDDPYMAVMQAYLATITDSESKPFKDSRETEIPPPLPIAPPPVPPSVNPYLIVRQTHTPATIDTEFEPKEDPLDTEEFRPLAARTTPPSSDHTPMSSESTSFHPSLTSPTPTRVSYYRNTIRMAVRTQPTLSPGMSARIAKAAALSPSLFRKRYKSSYETPSPPSSSTLPIRKRAFRSCELALREGSLPSTFEIGQSSRFVSEQQRVEETLAPRPLM
nr:hypothetical protein [Tanacetum cinerariifolium]